MIKFEYPIVKIWGIPIKAHLSLLFFLPVIAFYFSPMMGHGLAGWVWGLIIAIGLFVSVTLHELGHSYVAIKTGFRVRKILLLPIGGAAQLESMPSQPRQELLMAITGPGVSLVLAIIALFAANAVLFVFGWKTISKVLSIMASINIMLALFNLLPSFPMDGGRVFRALLTPKLGRLSATRLAANIGKGMAVIFGIIGVYPPFNLLLIAVAFFLYSTAGAEYKMVQLEQKMKSREENNKP